MEIRNFSAIITCPYCGFEFLKNIEKGGARERVRGMLVVCPLEDGGCDETFVVRFDTTIETEELKIEGAEQKS